MVCSLGRTKKIFIHIQTEFVSRCVRARIVCIVGTHTHTRSHSCVFCHDLSVFSYLFNNWKSFSSFCVASFIHLHPSSVLLPLASLIFLFLSIICLLSKGARQAWGGRKLGCASPEQEGMQCHRNPWAQLCMGKFWGQAQAMGRLGAKNTIPIEIGKVLELQGPYSSSSRERAAGREERPSPLHQGIPS